MDRRHIAGDLAFDGARRISGMAASGGYRDNTGVAGDCGNAIRCNRGVICCDQAAALKGRATMVAGPLHLARQVAVS